MVQNLMAATPAGRECLGTLLQSCSYVILFAGTRLVPVVRSLARNYFPGDRRLLDAFNCMMAQRRPYAYLLVDFCTLLRKFQFRENGLLRGEELHFFQTVGAFPSLPSASINTDVGPRFSQSCIRLLSCRSW